MIICLCHRVSDRDIVREAHDGCADFDELQDRLRVATACGACREHAAEAFDGACRGRCRSEASPARRAPADALAAA